MDHLQIIKALDHNRIVFENLLKDIPKEQYLWKSAPEKWSLLEILCHLYDEEKEDFRARTQHALYTPTEPLPKIDPPGWVEGRKYIEQNYDGKLADFLSEREQSVTWLFSLSNVDWRSAYIHPKFGEMPARMFLDNWLAHDYLHLRQIIKVKFDLLKERSAEDLGYAGNW